MSQSLSRREVVSVVMPDGTLLTEYADQRVEDPMGRYLAVINTLLDAFVELTGITLETLKTVEALADLPEWAESGLDAFHPDTTHNPQI